MPGTMKTPERSTRERILDPLEARNHEAIDRKLAFTDFLSLLIHDEVARLAARRT